MASQNITSDTVHRDVNRNPTLTADTVAVILARSTSSEPGAMISAGSVSAATSAPTAGMLNTKFSSVAGLNASAAPGWLHRSNRSASLSMWNRDDSTSIAVSAGADAMSTECRDTHIFSVCFVSAPWASTLVTSTASASPSSFVLRGAANSPNSTRQADSLRWWTMAQESLPCTEPTLWRGVTSTPRARWCVANSRWVTSST